MEEQAADGQEEDEDFVGPVPPAPATPPQECDSLDIDVGLDSASTGIQPMSVSGPGDCAFSASAIWLSFRLLSPHQQNCTVHLVHHPLQS